MSEISYVVDIKNLSKSFKRRSLTRGGYTTLKSSFLKGLGSFWGKKRENYYTHAIKDLTLRVPRGSSVGIIGQNGSGKSTFLKLLSGIYKPDKGNIKVQGRVAALIELGAGFHPDFSGRENLYLAGIMHGLSRKDIEDRFDEIVGFAELKEVIDEPVRTYSSGMFMRLGFSLAVHTEPDILMVDEVLAVGDASFVNKCKEKIAGLRKEHKTLLLVTHDLGAVERFCDEALWLHEGEVKDRGNPRRVIDHYREFVEKGEERQILQAVGEEVVLSKESSEEEGVRWGSREIEIVAVHMYKGEREAHLLFHPDDSVRVEIEYVVHDKKAGDTEEVVFGVCIRRNDGLIVHGSNTDIEKVKLPHLGDHGKVVYDFDRLGLLEGNYFLDVAVHRQDGYPYDYHQGGLKFLVRSPYKQIGVYSPQHRWEVVVNKDTRVALG